MYRGRDKERMIDMTDSSKKEKTGTVPKLTAYLVKGMFFVKKRPRLKSFLYEKVTVFLPEGATLKEGNETIQVTLEDGSICDGLYTVHPPQKGFTPALKAKDHFRPVLLMYEKESRTGKGPKDAVAKLFAT